MAAPAPPSPQQANNPNATSNTKENINMPPTSTPPSYLTTKQSTAYLAAKSHLSSGDLDAALTLTANQISAVRDSLLSASDSSSSLEAEMHEAMAPLYYLYGTTLLYLVEENETMMSGGQVSFWILYIVVVDELW